MASFAPLAVQRSFAFEGEGRCAEAAYERWREEGARLTALAYDVRRESSLFRAKSLRLELPEAGLVQFEYSGLTFDRSPRHVRSTDLEGVVVQLTHAGGLRGSFGDRDVAAGAGTAVLTDLSLPSLHATQATTGRVFYLPTSVFGADTARRLHGRVASGAAFRRLDSYFTWLLHAVRDAPVSAAERARISMAKVVRATFEPGAEPDLQASGALDGVVAARLRHLIARSVGDPDLNADGLARTLGVSRAALYRAASPSGGVMEMVWQARLDAVQAALTDPGRAEGVGAIGAEHGFSTAQHLSRRFRQRFGYSPSDLRLTLR